MFNSPWILNTRLIHLQEDLQTRSCMESTLIYLLFHYQAIYKERQKTPFKFGKRQKNTYKVFNPMEEIFLHQMAWMEVMLLDGCLKFDAISSLKNKFKVD